MANKELEIALTTYIALKHNQDEYSGFIDGYKQCQEDITKELEKLREQIRKNTWYDEGGLAQVNLYGIDSNLLNKQD